MLLTNKDNTFRDTMFPVPYCIVQLLNVQLLNVQILHRVFFTMRILDIDICKCLHRRK